MNTGAGGTAPPAAAFFVSSANVLFVWFDSATGAGGAGLGAVAFDAGAVAGSADFPGGGGTSNLLPDFSMDASAEFTPASILSGLFTMSALCTSPSVAWPNCCAM